MLSLYADFRCERWSKDGRLISRHRAKNGIVNVALNDILETAFRQGTLRTWCIGLYDSVGFTGLSASDTMSSHAGWTEITAYAEANRPAWGPGAATGQVVINSASVQFTMNANKVIRGLFVTSNNTKGGSTGILLSTGDLDQLASMQSAEVFKATYSLRAEGR